MTGVEGGPALERLPARDVPLGGVRAMTVRRSLPSRDRRTIGAWCFADHYGPAVVDASWQMDVPPHPHTGLQTVTWLLAGEVEHRDSLGTHSVIRPGQLNLMTSGRGIAHSEVSLALSLPGADVAPATLHGVQLWVALPEQARDQAPHFEQHAALPVITQPGAVVTVLLGDHGGERSAAATYTRIVGLQVEVTEQTLLALPADFEHGVLLLAGNASVEGEALETGSLLYLGAGRTGIEVRADPSATLLVLGGEPFAEDLVMWWNFVGRSHEEVARAREQWQAQDGRFGVVAGYPGDWLPAPDMPAVRLKPRPRMR